MASPSSITRQAKSSAVQLDAAQVGKRWKGTDIQSASEYTHQGSNIVILASSIELKRGGVGRENTVMGILRDADKELVQNGGSTAFLYTSMERNGHVIVQSHPLDQIRADMVAANYAFLKASIEHKLMKSNLYESFTASNSLVDMIHLPIVPWYLNSSETIPQPKMPFHEFAKLRDK